MNIHAPIGEAEWIESKGNALYEKLLPKFKDEGYASGLFVAINLETGQFLTAKTRLELIKSYKHSFGQSVGWVKQIEYDSYPDRLG